jgi:hypothetical protein
VSASSASGAQAANGTHSPTGMESRPHSWANSPIAEACAGNFLQAWGDRALSDLEHELHCEDCEHLYLMAWERWELYRCPHDRDDAVLHLHRMNVAILSRPLAVQMARHAAFEQRLDEGCDFFGAAGRAAHADLQGGAHA